jgi:hypothetical protein
MCRDIVAFAGTCILTQNWEGPPDEPSTYLGRFLNILTTKHPLQIGKTLF